MHSTSTNRQKKPKQLPEKKFAELPDWLTTEEARAFLRLGKSTLYERLRSEEIPSRRFGRQFRIAKEALRPEAIK